LKLDNSYNIFLTGHPDEFEVTKEFVEQEVASRIAYRLQWFGDGWLPFGEIHSREVQAMLKYIGGSLA
jgi:hypothetical protein